MIAFLAFAHMLNATQLVWGGGDEHVPCTCTHVEWYATGLGLGGIITFLELAHMLNAMQMVWGVRGLISLFALAHMLNAPHMVWGGGGTRFTYRTKNNKCRSFPPAVPLHTYTRVLRTT